MIRFIVVLGLAFAVIGALSITMAPGTLAMAIVALMLILMLLGFAFNMVPIALFSAAFRRGIVTIEEIHTTQSGSPWLAAQQVEAFFHQKAMDELYAAYVFKSKQQSKEGLTPSDIEDVINEASLGLRVWRSAAMQIPGTLTALGLLGTFVGLITGISSIGFSSVEAALTSIQTLLGGIQTAFYTSIVGVILSILFNVTGKLLWNVMLRNMGLFMEQFHLFILPSLDEQNRAQLNLNMKQVLERLDRIPKDAGYSSARGNTSAPANSMDEMRLMPEISEALKNGEFFFYLQPRCDLNSRKVIGGEALLRWKHGDMGLVSPALFLPVVEKNGFIAQIDTYIWESVIKLLREWIDAGIRPMPISVNISKTDILAIDIAEFFINTVRKYRVPPRYLELEIAENVYVQGTNIIIPVEEKLRQGGFRIVVDGFVGDFSAITEIRKCEPDAVKMDLRHISGKDVKDIRMAFSSAQKLNCTILAEGIETAEQLTALRHCGCSEGQGFYFYQPMPVEDFVAIMEKG